MDKFIEDANELNDTYRSRFQSYAKQNIRKNDEEKYLQKKAS